MFKGKKYIPHVTILVLAQLAAAQTIDLQIQSNKTEYICGEPVLLKTIVLNSSSQNFTGYAIGWRNRESGFTMYIAYGEQDFGNILSINTKLRLKVSTPPLQYDLFFDRHCFPPNLSPSQRAERLDMLIFPEPGDYKLKAVLKDRDGKIIRASGPIQFRVLPLNKTSDSISQLGNEDFLINFGSTVYYAHYIEKLWGGYPPGKSLDAKEFKEVAPVIIEKHRDSVFREYVMYADIMTGYRPKTKYHLLTSGHKELAERFVQEHPKSWLLPDIYCRLFWTYVGEKDSKKAEAIRNKALQKAPHATVLRLVKKKDLSKLDPKK